MMPMAVLWVTLMTGWALSRKVAREFAGCLSAIVVGAVGPNE
jgi:hypothetical protein